MCLKILGTDNVHADERYSFLFRLLTGKMKSLVVTCAQVPLELVHDRILDLYLISLVRSFFQSGIEELDRPRKLIRVICLSTSIAHLGRVEFLLDYAVFFGSLGVIVRLP
jgi:hypothetical protein